MLYYSAITNGFYDSSIHEIDTIPTDRVEITSDKHAQLLLDQSEGKVISGDSLGNPITTVADVDYVALAKITRNNAVTANLEVDGSTFQVSSASRDSISNTAEFIKRNPETDGTHEWILADDTTVIVSLAVLNTVLDEYTIRMTDVYYKYSLWFSGDTSTEFVLD